MVSTTSLLVEGQGRPGGLDRRAPSQCTLACNRQGHQKKQASRSLPQYIISHFISRGFHHVPSAGMIAVLWLPK
jgi:hypothetical protein